MPDALLLTEERRSPTTLLPRVSQPTLADILDSDRPKFDLETADIAIRSSLTGHLVFATLHTNSAAESINRIIDAFPSHQQSQVRAQLAFILEGVVTQMLLPKAKGPAAAWLWP